MLSNIWDVIVVGGGPAVSVISNRLHQNNSALNILVIEAGPDVSSNTITPYAANQGLLLNSPWDWNDTTVPQTSLNNRSIFNLADKGLGGGTIINSCKPHLSSHSPYSRSPFSHSLTPSNPTETPS